MLFNPTLILDRGYRDEVLTFSLTRKIDSSRPFGNIAAGDLSDAILALLVGLEKEIGPVINRALDWIDTACAKDEIFGADPNGHGVTLHWAKAIGNWIKNAEEMEDIWRATCQFEEARWHFVGRPWPKTEILKYGLDDFMAFAYQSGALNDGYSVGIEMYERFNSPNKKLSLKKILKPRDFAYALCLSKVGEINFSEEDLFGAGRKMSKENLEDNWLGGGQYIRAATWLKIVYWHRDKSISPLDCILRAYDNMPRVQKPNFE